MVVTLKNIGTIHEASFDLDKDLIVFIGPNNTGKTYAAYCLYGLGRFDKSLSKEINNRIIPDIDNLFSQGTIELNLEDIFTKSNVKYILEQYSLIYKNFLPKLFAFKEEDTKKSQVSFSLNDSFDLTQFFNSFNFQIISGSRNGAVYNFNKEKNSSKLIVSTEVSFVNGQKPKVDNDKNAEYIKDLIIDQVLSSMISLWDPTFLSAERIGISLFWKDIYSNRFIKTNDFIRILSDHPDKKIESINKELPIYSLVIQDSFRNYDQYTKTLERMFPSEPMQNLALQLETNVLNGTVHTDKEGEVFYTPANNQPIKIQAAGSVIKSLASLVFYLRYYVRSGQTLFIDEPEINLHPDNQRLVARILAKLSKLGVKVIISTHSDYIIRELNNLMMLNKEHPETKALREKYGYDESEILDHNRVGAYLFKDHHAKPIEVTESGMEAATIDEEISKLNKSSSDIYWTLFEG